MLSHRYSHKESTLEIFATRSSVGESEKDGVYVGVTPSEAGPSSTNKTNPVQPITDFTRSKADSPAGATDVDDTTAKADVLTDDIAITNDAKKVDDVTDDATGVEEVIDDVTNINGNMAMRPCEEGEEGVVLH